LRVGVGGPAFGSDVGRGSRVGRSVAVGGGGGVGRSGSGVEVAVGVGVGVSVGVGVIVAVAERVHVGALAVRDISLRESVGEGATRSP
jgi:hypothetical protein